MECVFCAIVSERVPASFVYQDSEIVAFMDGRPINPGHVLIIPRCHEPDIQNLPPALYSKLMLVGRHLAQAINATYAPKKVGFAVAGFDVPHAHLHVMPLHDYHDLTSRRYLDPAKPTSTSQSIEVEGDRIRAALGGRTPDFGIQW